jgi:hypothetical protein
MVKYVPHRPVFYHSQDSKFDCGRASMQMVMSSLVLGPPTGSPPTSEDAATVIPFKQSELRAREPFNTDDPDVPAWRTHPDELLHVMTTAPELSGKLANWRLAVRGSLDDLLSTLVEALAAGMPAILNVYSNDHWVVVISTAVDDATAEVVFIEVLDPLPHVRGITHTYIDRCSGNNEGTVLLLEQFSPAQLGNLQLEVGPLSPPGDLTHYAGQYVALVHGDAPRITARSGTSGEEHRCRRGSLERIRRRWSSTAFAAR